MAVLLILICSVAGAGALAEDRSYVPYSNIERGTDGLTPVDLRIENGAGGPVSCTANLAHWYTAPLGKAAPSGGIDVPLWQDPQTGELNLLNELTDRMPVEAIWCSQDGTAARTRVNLVLERGRAPTSLTYTCVDRRDGQLTCQDMTR